MVIGKKAKKIAAMLLAMAAMVCALACPAYATEYKGQGAVLTAGYDGKKLSLTASGELFTESEILPGDAIVSKVTVKNSTGADIKVRLVKVEDVLKNKDTPNLYEYMTVDIKQGTVQCYNGEMKDSKDLSVKLATVEKDKSIDYAVAVKLPETVGNEAQGAELDTNWVFEVQMREPNKPTQTVTIPVPSKVSIQSGVHDIYHSVALWIFLIVLMVAFVAVAIIYIYIKGKKGGKKNG